MQRSEINPINKHRSEIEKRLNQLEMKFAQTNQNVRIANNISNDNHIQPHRYRHQPPALPQERRQSQRPGKSTQAITNKGTIRSYGRQDEVAKQNISKTVEMRPKVKPVEMGNTLKREIYYDERVNQSLKQHNGVLEPRGDGKKMIDHKDQKIQQLQNMIKVILDGQKILQRQLRQLKSKTKQQVQPNDCSILQDQKGINQSSIANQNPQRYKKSNSLINKSDFIKEQTNHPKDIQDPSPKDKRVGKRLTPLKQKQKQFEQLYMKLKSKQCSNQRMQISQSLRNTFWNEVQGRIRQSDRQYRDTLHRNNKHEFEHLMNTYQLQRKLKDELIEKVYQECNNQIYK